MPCCFKKSRIKKNNQTEKANEDKYYVLGVEKSAKIERIAFVSDKLISSLHINESYESFKASNVRRLMSPNKGFFRTGLGHSSENLSKLIGLKTKIPSPREAVEITLKCSFVSTWQKMGDKHLESIQSSLHKFVDDSVVREELSKIISGIDHAFDKKELTPLQELEYSALALNCDVFYIDQETESLKCFFNIRMVRSRSRAVIVLQLEHELNIIAYTERKSRGFDFRSNIYEAPFKRETAVELEKLRNKSCKLFYRQLINSKIPNYTVYILNIMVITQIVSLIWIFWKINLTKMTQFLCLKHYLILNKYLIFKPKYLTQINT
jgi:hypothetical protein